ncbi:Kinesin motor domain containing protein [Globisporangium polare]
MALATPRAATAAEGRASTTAAAPSPTTSFVAQARIRVVVRVRPKLALEKNDSSDFLTINRSRNSLQLSASAAATEAKSFVFDQVFDPQTTQPEIYDQIGFASMLSGVLEGYHATIFAYGQTGSGKTFTMEGSEYEIIPRVIFNLFEMISSQSVSSTATGGRREFIVKCSFVQIYNEQILDLFNPSHLHQSTPSSSSSSSQPRKAPAVNKPKSNASPCGLKLRWSAAREFYVENLRVLECQSPEQVIKHFQEGIKHKVMASHRLNAASSRSHCVFTIYVESFDPSDNPSDILQSKLALVDLAGSERIDKTGATGVTLQESIGINKSLFVLRQVIQALSEESNNSMASNSTKSKDRAYIPYRDSKLTSLLKYSLGGNSLTLMIACLSPSDAHFDENLSTLVYASKAQCIANKPMKNEDPKTVLIHELRLEVEALRRQLAQAQDVILSFQQIAPRGETQINQQQQEQGSSVPSKHQSLISSRESVTTKKLKLSVIDNVEMIKELYATEKLLTDRVRAQSRRIEDLAYETRVLNVENQSLRDKLEVLEYLVADQRTSVSVADGGENNSSEPEEPEEIPGYGALTSSSASSLPRVNTSAPAPERIREVLRGSRKSSSRDRASAENEAAASSRQKSNKKSNQTKTEPQTRRKDLETGLLSLNELKDLLSGKRRSEQQPLNSNSSSRPGRTMSNGRPQPQSSQVQAEGRSDFPAPPPTKQSASSSGLLTFSSSDRSNSRVTIRTTPTASLLSTLEQNPSQQPRRSAFELDPLDSLSELNRLLQVKATLRRVSTANATEDSIGLGTK